MSLGMILLIGGIVIVVVAFAFMARNMWRGVSSLVGSEEPSTASASTSDFNLGSLFKNHLGGMVVIAIGSGMGAIGLVLILINLFNR